MKQPNIILIMTDDQGYGDLSCMGARDFVTPNIDRLAASGVRFTDWYSNSPVCSPSRASLLTGRYMDIFPTVLKAAGGDPGKYELDGLDIMAVLRDGAVSPHDMIFWEMDDQTAVRRGNYKIVLNGRTVEEEKPVCPVHLSDLSVDPGEEKNLIDVLPGLSKELETSALEWRRGIEKWWETEWVSNYKNQA